MSDYFHDYVFYNLLRITEGPQGTSDADNHLKKRSLDSGHMVHRRRIPHSPSPAYDLVHTLWADPGLFVGSFDDRAQQGIYSILAFRAVSHAFRQACLTVWFDPHNWSVISKTLPPGALTRYLRTLQSDTQRHSLTRAFTVSREDRQELSRLYQSLD
jgi:hypothetical protein